MDRSFMSNGYSIGVELGDPNLRVAAYSGETDFFDSIALPTRLSAGRDQIVRDMSEAAKTLAGRRHGNRKLTGIAVGTPGQAITLALGRDIVLESDANLAASADYEPEKARGMASTSCASSRSEREWGTDRS
jgi:glucokinase